MTVKELRDLIKGVPDDNAVSIKVVLRDGINVYEKHGANLRSDYELSLFEPTDVIVSKIQGCVTLQAEEVIDD